MTKRNFFSINRNSRGCFKRLGFIRNLLNLIPNKTTHKRIVQHPAFFCSHILLCLCNMLAREQMLELLVNLRALQVVLLTGTMQIMLTRELLLKLREISKKMFDHTQTGFERV